MVRLALTVDLAERPVAEADFERHPWELSRFRFFSGVLQRSMPLSQTRSVLDVGAGDAWFAQQLRGHLADGAQVTCCDEAYTDAMIAAQGATSPLQLCRQVPQQAYELVVLLDVLEHVADDRSFLRGLVERHVAPEGRVLISVPAWQQLYTQHDTYLKHHRRYSPTAARALVEQSGLQVLSSGGLFHSLLLPRAAQKVVELVAKRSAQAQQPPSLEWRGGAVLRSAVDWALRVDNMVSTWTSSRSVQLPGLSWWALCKKSS